MITCKMLTFFSPANLFLIFILGEEGILPCWEKETEQFREGSEVNFKKKKVADSSEVVNIEERYYLC